MIKNAKLQNMIKLSSKITVYIPSTIDIDKKIDNTQYVNNCASLLSKCFGDTQFFKKNPVFKYEKYQRKKSCI
jgi:hypothetical protein